LNEKPVFYDSKGRRKRQASWFGAAIGLISAVLLTVVVVGLFLLPFIPGLPGSKQPVILRSSHPSLNGHEDSRITGYIFSQINAQLKRNIKMEVRSQPTPKASSGGPIVAAFYEPWQDTSLNSLRENAQKITHLMPTWLSLTADGTGLDLSNFDVEDPRTNDVVDITEKDGILVYPVLNNMEQGTPDEKSVATLLNSKALRASVISQLVNWLVAHKFEGVNIDFEELKDPDYEKMPGFYAELTAALHAHNLGTSFDLESSEISSASDMVANVDFAILMNYDFSSENGLPGPIAPLEWFTGNIKSALAEIPANKLVVGMGNYGYDWDTKTKQQAQSISYQDAAMLAQESRDDLPISQRIVFDPDALNSHYTYDDDDGDHHDVWLLDGPSAYNEYKVSRDFGVRGEALWELGTEDPSIWNFYNARQTGVPNANKILNEVSFPYEINFHGNGEILDVPTGFGVSKPGQRTVTTDADGFVVNAVYQKYPTPIVINRIGKDPKKPPYEVALTFDDGPVDTYTGEILTTLEDLNVPGTFFVIGENAISHPGLLRREYADGFEIGSHTFTHPNMAEVSETRAKLEMDATQRAIQSIIGRSTLLFRPPYNADVEPTSVEEVAPVVLASQMGYYTVGESVDPQDWNLQAPGPHGGMVDNTTKNIVDIVLRGVKGHEGSVVLLHDGGGDRHMTVEALKQFVPKLQAAGFKFVTVSQLLNDTRDQVMPPLKGEDLILLPFERVFFYLWYVIATFLTLAFLTAIGLGIARIFFITPLAIVANRKAKSVPMLPLLEEPFVSVIVAAYNEEEVIVRTIESVLGSSYKQIEVIVVDDGSKDTTLHVVQKAFAGNSMVTVLSQENGGKAAALNFGMDHCRGDVYVYLDADTILASDAIQKLVRHFADEKVGAVAGNVKVGNRINTLTRLQSVEYIASQNLDRRAYAYINTVTVVPGAIGAWRKTAVQSAGGYTSDTLAEDMDLTWRVRLAGWKIDNESEAIAYTEAPATLSSFFKQRFRWTFGTLQCLFKHRKSLGKSGLFGRLALPMLWVYQFGIQIIAPFVDLQLLYSLLVFGSAWASHSVLTRDWRPLSDATQTMAYIGFMYALFFMVEFVSAFIAFRMDHEKKSQLWWLFLQRLVYRQVLYAVVWKALWQALKGARTGWGKFERQGTVTLASPRNTRGREDAPAEREQVGSEK
jgi:peptidoglycan-N-acetylglucosamine deacetylase